MSSSKQSSAFYANTTNAKWMKSKEEEAKRGEDLTH
jgi:hypothetical protein